MRGGAGLGPPVVLGEPPDRRVIDRDAVDAMRLGGPQDRPGRASTNARVNPIAAWATSISLQRSPSSWLRRAPVDAASHR